ncbi:MAG: hypothetical protein IKX69_05500 [Prevotella sp.]|nr:hypothetical protein [Prevotella sp.]MBR5698544.1 hypothetical protein [Prevotella sp.]
METTTLIYLLVAIVAVLVLLVTFLVWRMSRKNDELRKKDDIIVREVRRNQAIIERAVQQGIHRSTLL